MHIVWCPVLTRLMLSVFQYLVLFLAFELISLQLFSWEFDCFSSGKCQIVHWRQGHKEECHPFTSSHESNEEEGSYQKVLKQEERKNHDNSIETNEKERNSSLHEKERSDKHQSTNVFPDKLA